MRCCIPGRVNHCIPRHVHRSILGHVHCPDCASSTPGSKCCAPRWPLQVTRQWPEGREPTQAWLQGSVSSLTGTHTPISCVCLCHTGREGRERRGQTAAQCKPDGRCGLQTTHRCLQPLVPLRGGEEKWGLSPTACGSPMRSGMAEHRDQPCSRESLPSGHPYLLGSNCRC